MFIIVYPVYAAIAELLDNSVDEVCLALKCSFGIGLSSE